MKNERFKKVELLIDVQHLEVMIGDVRQGISFLEDIAEIVEEPYFNEKEFWGTLERLRSLEADLMGLEEELK